MQQEEEPPVQQQEWQAPAQAWEGAGVVETGLET